MAEKIHVKKDDRVFVLTGKDAGKTGKVIAVDRKSGRIYVENVNMVTKHMKPRSRTQTGGIVHQEAAIHASNVMLVCPKCKRPAKTGIRILENGERVRFCKACDEMISTVAKAKKK